MSVNELQTEQQTDLSDDLNVLTAEIKVDLQGISESIFRVGARLKHVRENDLVHGEWSAWLEDELNLSHEHARRFIKVYERFSKSTPVWNSLPNSMSVLYALTSFSDEELAKPRHMPDGSTKKLTEMSRREIEEFKRREREAVAEKEKALAAAQEAEQRAQQAERESERLRNRPRPEHRVETRTEYIEVEDVGTQERLRKYEERFGDIGDYEQESATRITNAKDVTAMVMLFSKNVRELVKRFAHLKMYKSEMGFVDDVTKREYEVSVKALRDLADDLAQEERAGAKVIDINYGGDF